jgi:hypothetical protein
MAGEGARRGLAHVQVLVAVLTAMVVLVDDRRLRNVRVR